MVMDRARRLRDFWDYLPGFRAVAETEHLPTAALGLGLSTSALSRTVRLLEDRVGHPLFDRVGRGLRLNAAGHLLARAVRDAMRVLDDGVHHGDGTPRGELNLTAAPTLRWLVGPWLARLTVDLPQVLVRERTAPADLGAALRTGEVDVALASGPCAAEGVRSERLPDLAWRVFRRGVAPPRFVVSPDEPWPVDSARAVAAFVADVATAAASCGPGLRALVPERVGAAAGLTASSPVVARTAVYVVSRQPVATHAATEAALAAARHVMASPVRRRRPRVSG